MLLAAGSVQRTGTPLALVEHEGMRLVERGLRTLVAGGCGPVIVVLGCGAQAVREGANLNGAVVIINRDWRDGLGSSLRAGLNALEPTLVDGVCFLLNETPGVTAAAVRRVNALGADDALVAATYEGHLGHPVLLGRKHWPGVAGRAIGEYGARPYMRAHAAELTLVACDDVSVGRDIDGPDRPTPDV
jgi:nicotine blue oxidoreductase